MKPTTQPKPGAYAGTGELDRSSPDSMDQADRANGENDAADPANDAADPASEINDELVDDPAITGVQDGD